MNVVIPETKDKAIKEATSCKEATVYVDSSMQNGLVGIGAYWQNMQGWGPMSHTIADSSKLTNDAGELAAIEAVIVKIWFHAEHKQLQNQRVVIFTDSIHALNMLNCSARGSGQFLAGSILRLNHLIHVSPQNISLTLQWSPAHSKIAGNDYAYILAQQATRKGQQIQCNLQEFPLAKSIVLRHSAHLDQKEIISPTLGANTRGEAFTRSVDKASPRYHTSNLYNGKSKAQASVLCQLRTGIAHLNSHLAKINAVRSEMCSCNTGVETVHHFLFYCPLWVEFRRNIRDLGYRHNRWEDTSFFVSGWSEKSKDGEEKKWKPNGEAVWATINYAVNTGRLKSRKEEVEVGPTQRLEEPDGSGLSDIDDRA